MRLRPSAWSPRIGTGAWLAATAVVVLWAALRATGLSRFPPFWDESFYAVQAHTGLEDPSRRWDPLFDAKGPLHNWLAMAFDWIGASPLTAVRLVSVAAGLATLVLVAALGRRLGGDATALAAAALYAISPIFVVHDTIGVSDPMVTAFGTGALLCALRLADRPTVGRAAVLGLVLGLALLTKVSAAFALLALPVMLLLARERIRFFVAAVGAAALAVAMLQLPRLSSVYSEASRFGEWAEGVVYRAPGDVLGEPFRYASDAVRQYADQLGAWVSLPLLLALVPAALALRRRPEWRLGVVLAAWSLAAAMSVALLAPVLWGRYLIASLPPLLVLLAFGLVAAARWVAERRGGPALAAVVVAAALAPSLVFAARWLDEPGGRALPSAKDDVVYRTGGTAGTGWEDLADAVRAEMGDRPVTRLAYGTGTPWFLGVLLDDPNWPAIREGGVRRETFTVSGGGGRLVVLPRDRTRPGRYELFAWDRSSGPAPRAAVRGMARVLVVPRRDTGALELYRRTRDSSTSGL